MSTPLGPIQVLRDILVHEMGVDEERIMFYNQKWDIPTDSNLFMELEYKYGTPYSNRNSLPIIKGVATEQGDVNMKEKYTIKIFSKDTSALARKEEILMALASIYSQQQQESNSFRIFPIMQIQDVSEVEASARLYRYDIEVTVFAWYSKTKIQEYYNSLNVEVLVDEGRTKLIEVDFEQPTP